MREKVNLGEEFIRKAKLVHGDKYDYSLVDYTNNHTKVKIICLINGIVEQTPHHHLDGFNPRNQREENKTNFIQKAIAKYGHKYDYSKVEYLSDKKKVIIICDKHGEFEQAPRHHLNSKYGCTKCGTYRGVIKIKKPKVLINGRLITERTNKISLTFIDDCIKIHGELYDYSKTIYEKGRIKVIITCKSHGDFKQRPSAHLSGAGCPTCIESKGEKIIRNWLIENNIIFLQRHSFKKCRNILPLPFDFYLPNHNVCIEFNGIQHYEPVKYFGGDKYLISISKRDNIKKSYCFKNNIKLFIIKYNEKTNDKLNELLNYISTIT